MLKIKDFYSKNKVWINATGFVLVGIGSYFAYSKFAVNGKNKPRR